MSKFRTSILIIGILTVIVGASLLTVLALYGSGAIVSDPIELVFTIDDETKYYDGEPLRATEYNLKSGKILEGHTAEVTLLGEQTAAGTSKSDLSIKVLDKKGRDVTKEYSVTVENGELTVLPEEITVRLDDSEVVYSGQKIVFDEYTVTDGALASGHKVAGSVSDAGVLNVGDRLPADLQPLIYDINGVDVTRNYNVHFEMGVIEIIPRPITVKPVDMQKIYDGTPLECTKYELVSGSLVNGHYAEASINYGEASQTYAGETYTLVTDMTIYEIRGSERVDVTDNYNIDATEAGILTVLKRDLVITAKDGEWEYDGGQHSLESDPQPKAITGLAPTDELLSVTYGGQIKDAGTAVNYISETLLSSSSDNYNITCISGELKVTPRQISVVTTTKIRQYDGTPLTGREVIVDNEVSGHVIELPDVTPSITDVGSVSNEFRCTVSDEGGFDVTDNYKIIYSFGVLTVNKKPVNINLKDYTPVYSGSPYELNIEDVFAETLPLPLTSADFTLNAPDMKDAGQYTYTVTLANAANATNYDIAVKNGKVVMGKLQVNIAYNYGTTGETSVSKTYDGTAAEIDLDGLTLSATGVDLSAYKVYSAQYDKVIDFTTSKVLTLKAISIMDGNGDPVTQNLTFDNPQVNVSINKRPLTVEAKSGEWVYDGKAHSVTDPQPLAVRGLAAGDSVLSVTYAATSTQTNVGNSGNAINSVELSADADNYAITFVSGSLTVTPRDITVSTGSAEREYNGSPLSAESISATNLPVGESVNVRGGYPSITDAGNAENAVVFYVSNGYAETTTNYNINKNFGTLTVKKSNVKVTLGEITHTFDGKAFTPAQTDIENAVQVSSAGYEFNFADFNLSCDKNIKNVGLYDYTLVPKTNDNKNFEISVQPSKIEITSAAISVAYSDGALITKTYDGLPAEVNLNAFVLRLNGVVLSGYRVSFVNYNRIVNANNSAESLNLRDFVFVDSDGNVATQNFTLVSSEVPALSVKIDRRQITVSIRDYNYDGTEYPDSISSNSLSGYATFQGLAANDYAVDVVCQYNRSSHTIRLGDYTFFGPEGDVTDNYEISNENAFGQVILKG